MLMSSLPVTSFLGSFRCDVGAELTTVIITFCTRDANVMSCHVMLTEQDTRIHENKRPQVR